jgi:hypothetical protein
LDGDETQGTQVSAREILPVCVDPIVRAVWAVGGLFLATFLVGRAFERLMELFVLLVPLSNIALLDDVFVVVIGVPTERLSLIFLLATTSVSSLAQSLSSLELSLYFSRERELWRVYFTATP